MSLLSLDLGTKLGWAVYSSGEVISGAENFSPGRFEGGGMRFLKFKGFLVELRNRLEAMKQPLKAVYFEEVRRHLGVDAAHVYGGFMSHLQAWGDKNNIPYTGVPVGTIKKHVSGKGNTNKQGMIDAVRARGYEPGCDNEADAIALMLWAIVNHPKD